MTDQTTLNTAQAAAFLGLAERTLTNSRYGDLIGGRPGPRYRKVGARCMYLVSDLREWLAQFEVVDPSAAAPAPELGEAE
ncbi:MAG: helix-turn-helix domain-containing protein [Pseudomonadales bacterium]|nr:helix-turn-helix domain-containing protein [Pseudomonadales bacterium]